MAARPRPLLPRLRTLSTLITPMVLVLALTCSGCGRSSAQEALPTWSPPSLPDTPAGRQLSGFLTAFNGGDEGALAAFVTGHFTPTGPQGGDLASRVRSQQRLYRSSRGLNVYEVGESNDAAVTVVVQFRLTQEWRRMTLMVEPEPPHRISGIMIVPVDPPVSAGPPLTVAEVGREIDAYVQGLVAADEFSGVVLLARDGERLFEKAYGLADREANAPNQAATRFNYASVGKMFTAVAVAQLAEAGALSYDDLLAEHLPEYPADVAGRVTVEHLLTHHSGIVDLFADFERFDEVAGSADPQRDYLPLFMDEPLRFEPGARFEYSNSNYILLGAIVERASGQPFGEYLREHVFGPAGMAETSLRADGVPDGLLARNYTAFDADLQPGLGPRHLPEVSRIAVGSAAGGGYTTVGDLLRFDRALRTNELLSPEATRSILTDRVAYERPGYRYGYGFIFRRAGEETLAGHSGGAEGVDAQFDMYLGSGYTVVVLANYELVAEPVVTRIQHLLRRS